MKLFLQKTQMDNRKNLHKKRHQKSLKKVVIPFGFIKRTLNLKINFSMRLNTCMNGIVTPKKTCVKYTAKKIPTAISYLFAIVLKQIQTLSIPSLFSLRQTISKIGLMEQSRVRLMLKKLNLETWFTWKGTFLGH